MPGVREVFQERLRHYRKDRGLPSSKVADAIGKKYKTILNWESGYGSPSIEDIFNLCVALDIEPSDLFPKVEKGDVPASANDDEVTLLREFRSLGSNERKVVLGMISGLASRLG